MKTAVTEETFIPNWGPSDIRQWETGYSSSSVNPGYLAFRNPNNGMIVGAVAIGVPYWVIIGKYSGAWDRIIDFGNARNNDNAKIYWYSDMSNSYEGIEKFAKQVLNPLRVELIMDADPPDTGIRTIPEAPDGQNLYFITPVTIELFADESATTYYRWDGGAWQIYSTPIAAPSGSHLLEYYSVDSSGNSEPVKSRRFDFDSSPPAAFELVSPPDGYIGNGSAPSFSWLPSEDSESGLEGYDLFVDGVPVASLAESETAVPLLSPLPDGAHTWFVRAKDRAGNYKDSATWMFTVDSVPPVTSISLDPPLPNGSNGWYRTPVKAALDATDSGSGVGETFYSLDGGSTWVSYKGQFTIGSAGTHEILFRSVDVAGNVEIAKSQLINISQIAPEAGIYYDPETKDLKVVGYDALGGTINATYTEHDLRGGDGRGSGEDRGEGDRRCANGAWKLRIYSLADEAGNALELAIKTKRKGKEIKAAILSLSYNGDDAIEAPENELKFEWSVDKDEAIRMLNQSIELKGAGLAKAHYDRKKDETSINVKNGVEKPISISKRGLLLLRIATSRGDLRLVY